MKLNIKHLILIVFGFIANLSNAQMTPCCGSPCFPTPACPACPTCPDCTTTCDNCMDIYIVNQTGCDLNFYWGYSNCTYILGAQYPIYAGTQNGLIAQCAKCPGVDSNDQPFPCECPNRLMVSTSATQQWWPWGDFSTMIATGNTTYQLLNPNNTLCQICGIGVKVDITITGPNSATLTFSCV